MVQSLRREGYLVLEAIDSAGALFAVRTHSRPIQLMLIDSCINHGVLVSALRQYRPQIEVLFVARQNGEPFVYALTPETALAQVRAFFQGPKSEGAINQ